MARHFYIHNLISSCAFRVAVLTLLTSLTTTVHADVITDWNQIALNATNAINLPFPQQTRAMAMTHAAMFDAVNSIDHRYSSYAIRIQAPSGSSPEAAAAAAGHRVLVNLAPTQQASLDAAYAASLAQIPDGCSKTAGYNSRRDSCGSDPRVTQW